jgi:hypothetical protein
MNNPLYILILFIIVVLIKFLINITKYFYLKKVIIKHDAFLDWSEDEENEYKKQIGIKAQYWIQENILEIKSVVGKSGVGDQTKSYMKPVGLGYVQQRNISALDNLLFLNSEIIELARDLINRAKGYYKIQALKSFNPLYWIELIIFLPKELLKYVGVTGEERYSSTIIRIFQILYWVASVYFMYQSYLQSLK